MSGILDLFTGVKLSELTQSEIESVANSLTISENTRSDLEDLATVEASLISRAGNISIIQELGGVSVLNLVDSSPITQTVTANQVWKIQNVAVINSDGANEAVVTIQVNDGSNGTIFFQESVAPGSTVLVKMGNLFAGELFTNPGLQIIADQDGASTGVVVSISYQVKQV